MCFFSEYEGGAASGHGWHFVAVASPQCLMECWVFFALLYMRLALAHVFQQLLPAACRQAQQVQVAYALDPPACRAAFNRTHPYVLQRDLTIRTSEPPELGQMDFVFLMRKVLLAPNVTLTLEQVVLRNVNKLGGFGLDFFMVSWCAAVP